VYSKEAERSNRFLPDPEIPTGSASDADYRRSGYDRGHLAPAADMRFSSSAMKECFYYSNISPQDPSFNRGIWSSLEEQTRDWAMEAGSVCITTGPLFYGEYSPVIGPDRVAVPDFFFKAILDYRSATPKAIAFIIPNRKADSPLPKFACSVDEAERLSGLDFFPALPDCIETTVEATENISLWFPEDH
jgi:DNA/RNA endonuclease G, NUC1